MIGETKNETIYKTYRYLFFNTIWCIISRHINIWGKMKFIAQIKRVVRKSTVSNDTEFEVLLVTDQPLTELMTIGADQLIECEVKCQK